MPSALCLTRPFALRRAEAEISGELTMKMKLAIAALSLASLFSVGANAASLVSNKQAQGL